MNTLHGSLNVGHFRLWQTYMASLLLEAGTEQSYFRYHHHHKFLSEKYQKFQSERINAEKYFSFYYLQVSTLWIPKSFLVPKTAILTWERLKDGQCVWQWQLCWIIPSNFTVRSHYRAAQYWTIVDNEHRSQASQFMWTALSQEFGPQPENNLLNLGPLVFSRRVLHVSWSSQL